MATSTTKTHAPDAPAAPAKIVRLAIVYDNVLREPIEASALKAGTSVSAWANEQMAKLLNVVLPAKAPRVKKSKAPAFASLADVTDAKAAKVGARIGQAALVEAALARMQAALTGGEQWSMDVLKAANEQAAAAAKKAAETPAEVPAEKAAAA